VLFSVSKHICKVRRGRILFEIILIIFVLEQFESAIRNLTSMDKRAKVQKDVVMLRSGRGGLI